MENVLEIDHPVVKRYLSVLRDKNTETAAFRRAMGNIGTILAYHALDHLPLKEYDVDTPIKTTTGFKPAAEVFVIPILRAGLSLVDGIISFMPDAKVGHIGVYRDEETHEPVNYYHNFPGGLEDAYTLVVDPMLATGGSGSHALKFLKENGANNIRFVTLICAPEGINRILEDHPDVPIITAAIDENLNDNAFIVPGLGDAGDRYFGTL
ncbi:uracil phosphoribosyltransferase [Gracilimonas mengyeensis]|uniref:Uracil phosphoribosyltransferase n=1 Tax=Gracilimonas mengyeensis TaxID=1302730 RepID=A0A521FGV7_9BACT|nr:uracil phosphoribosyltransferase [Gracilimonas mengyeensis]SMO95423.1 uracil phosphoribosyltransferase [Gracilimonas mengyeensis]